MEEMFKKNKSSISPSIKPSIRSTRAESPTDAEETLINSYKNNNRFKFTFWACLFMLLFYITTLISHKIEHGDLDEIFFLILISLLTHCLLFVLILKIEGKVFQTFVKWFVFLLFYAVQIYRTLDSIFVSHDEYKIIKNIMLIFFSKFYLVIFFKFNIVFIVFSCLVNTALVGLIQFYVNKHVYIVEFTYAVIIPTACVVVRVVYENMIAETTANFKENAKMMRYTDALINGLTSFFFTMSKASVVYMNATMTEWCGNNIASGTTVGNTLANNIAINIHSNPETTHGNTRVNHINSERDYTTTESNKLLDYNVNKKKYNAKYSTDCLKNLSPVGNNNLTANLTTINNLNSKVNIINHNNINTINNININIHTAEKKEGDYSVEMSNANNNGLNSDSSTVKDFLKESWFTFIDPAIVNLLQLKTTANKHLSHPRYSLCNVISAIESNKNEEVNSFFSEGKFHPLGINEFTSKTNAKFFFQIALRKILLGCSSWVEVTMTDVTFAQRVKNIEASYKNRENILAKIAHEFKTPLMCVVSLFEEIQAGMTAAYGVNGVNLPLEIKHKVAHVGDLSNYTLFLLSDIIGYLKDTKQNLPLNVETVNVSEVLSFAFRILKTLLLYKKDKIQFIEPILESEEHEIEVKTDINRLKQILLNLISNAVKFTKSGFIKIKSALIHETMTISVEDTGMGIREEDSKKIFNEEKMLDDHLNENANGSGLGLSISFNVAKSMGGVLEFTSVYGAGSKFMLKLGGATMKRRKSINASERLSSFANANRGDRNIPSMNDFPLKEGRKVNSMSNITSLFKSGLNRVESAMIKGGRGEDGLNINENNLRENLKRNSSNNFNNPLYNSHQEMINPRSNSNSNSITIRSHPKNSSNRLNEIVMDNNIFLIEKEATEEARSLTTHNQDIFFAIDENKKLQMIHSEMDSDSNFPSMNNGANYRPGKAILLIDDTPLILSSMERIILNTMRTMNLQDVEIIKGFDGVDMIRHIVEDQRMNRILFTIVDEKMEFLNGSEAMRVVRKMEKENRIRKQVICRLSADSGLSSSFMESPEFFFDQNFEKPLSAYVFQDFLENLLR